MLNVAQIETFYSYFYRQKYKDYKFCFKRTKTTESVCNSFLKLVDQKYSLHSVGKDFLYDYFLFQFNYWHELDLQNNFTDKIVIAWIVGKKAFERWQERDQQFDWQMESYPIIQTYELNKRYVLALSKPYEEPIQILKSKSVPYDSSKPIRKKFLNTEKGFITCIELTTLFNPSDLSCIRCIYRTDCKELLKANFPELYSKRIN